MKKALVLAFGATAMVSIGAVQLASAATDTSSARRNDAYSVKNAHCKAQANKMHWGIHRLKRNRWIKNCIAS